MNDKMQVKCLNAKMQIKCLKDHNLIKTGMRIEDAPFPFQEQNDLDFF